jgi:hypothetical protein
MGSLDITVELKKFHTAVNINKGGEGGGDAVAQLIETQRYKLEGRGFDFRRSHWNFTLT